MKKNKNNEYVETVHKNGSFTFTPSEKAGVGFYHPFCLLKKDFNFNTVNTETMKSIVFILKLLTSVSTDNRLLTSQMKAIGLEISISEKTVSRMINLLNESLILIKVSHGIYKVNEDLILFKQDHEGYMALKEETKHLTQINIINNDGKDSNNLMQQLLKFAENNESQKNIGNI